MSNLWSELRAAIARLNYLFASHKVLAEKVVWLEQQLRDVRGR